MNFGEKIKRQIKQSKRKWEKLLKKEERVR